MKRTVFLLIVAAAEQSLLPRTSRKADGKNAPEESLRGKPGHTKTGIDRIRIIKRGTVVVIQKEGISGDLASDVTFLNDKLDGGDVAQIVSEKEAKAARAESVQLGQMPERVEAILGRRGKIG